MNPPSSGPDAAVYEAIGRLMIQVTDINKRIEHRCKVIEDAICGLDEDKSEMVEIAVESATGELDQQGSQQVTLDLGFWEGSNEYKVAKEQLPKEAFEALEAALIEEFEKQKKKGKACEAETESHVSETTPKAGPSSNEAENQERVGHVVIDIADDAPPKGSIEGRKLSVKLRELTTGVIKPDTRGIWDAYLIFLLLWVSLVLPYTIGFGIAANPNTTIGIIDIIVDISFVIDILLNFRTAYFDDDGDLITDRSMIANNYLKGWFGLDVLSVLPLNYLESGGQGGSAAELLRTTKILKATKMLRVIKAVKLMHKLHVPELLRLLETMFGRLASQALRIMFSIIVLGHWCGCFFYYIGFMDGDSKSNWIYASGLSTAQNVDRYIGSIYWSFATLTSVGYGDIVPVNVKERIVASVCMFLGATVFAFLTGALSSLLSAKSAAQRHLTTVMENVDRFMRIREIPTALSKRVRQYCIYVVSKGIQFDEAQFLRCLPRQLNTQMVNLLFRDTLRKVPFFRGRDPRFVTEVVLMLRTELYTPGDLVCVQGEPCTEIYFVGEGVLSALLYDEVPNLHNILYSGGGSTLEAEHLGYITAGSDFGQFSCLRMSSRTATVVATTYCEIYSLSRPDLMAVLEDWPIYSREMTQKLLEQNRNLEGIHNLTARELFTSEEPDLVITTSPCAWKSRSSEDLTNDREGEPSGSEGRTNKDQKIQDNPHTEIDIDQLGQTLM